MKTIKINKTKVSFSDFGWVYIGTRNYQQLQKVKEYLIKEGFITENDLVLMLPRLV